jgi:hypothetical protein
MEGVASGELTPNEAAALSTAVGNFARTIETVENSERLDRVEERLKGLNA